MLKLNRPLEEFNFIQTDKEHNIGHFIMINERNKDSVDSFVQSVRKETKICYTYEEMYRFFEHINNLYTNLKGYSNNILRIYMHINGFITEKVKYELAKRFLDDVYYKKQSASIYKLINSMHCISETNNNNYVHIDIDNNSDEHIALIKDAMTETVVARKQKNATSCMDLIIDEYPTVSGYHIITRRFDKNLFNDILAKKQSIIDYEVKDNSFALVGIIE